MSKLGRFRKALKTWFKKRVGLLVESRFISWIANFPPFVWLIRTSFRRQNKEFAERTPRTTAKSVAGVGLKPTLQQIVYDVVEVLGYAGAMVATYEPNGSLPARAVYVDPKLATEKQIHRWEEMVSKRSNDQVSITDPDIARVFVCQDKYADNLSVQAFKAGKPVISNELYALFTPIAPPASRPVVKIIQDTLGVKQVIAVPFFLEASVDGQLTKEFVGNLFAVKQCEISEQDERILSAFGRQAATAIESERRHIQVQVTQKIVFGMQANIRDEEQILQQIAKGVVSELGYAGAMVATYEPNGSLPVRALYVDPSLATEKQIHRWEEEVSKYSKCPVSITDPDIARVFVHRGEYEDNLSVRAYKAGRPVVSNELFALFTPVAPPASRSIVQVIQDALGVKQVIAVPFFLEKSVDGQSTRELVGNLVAATRLKQFNSGEISLLKAFGQQAAVGIRNARLYHKAEERRKVAQVFGKMAFSMAASAHALRNHIGAFQTYLHVVQQAMLPDRSDRLLELNTRVSERLDEVVGILEHLHEPWHDIRDFPTDINACLVQAGKRVIRNRDKIEASEGIIMHESLSDDLPPVKASPDMLTEACRILVKNAVEAIKEKGQGGTLQIESRLGDASTVELLISDSGVGIKEEDLSQVFEMQWSTKEAGMGFGLFWTKEYIEGLGGSIKVESVWGEGTTFKVCLPSFVE